MSHHDRMRARRGAFDVAIGALRLLRQLGMPTATAYAVTRDSLRDTADFAELVNEHAVRASQLRPLVMAGRDEFVDWIAYCRDAVSATP